MGEAAGWVCCEEMCSEATQSQKSQCHGHLRPGDQPRSQGAAFLLPLPISQQHPVVMMGFSGAKWRRQGG